MPRSTEKPLSTEEKVLLAGVAALATGLVAFWFFSPDAPGSSTAQNTTPPAPDAATA